MNKILKKSKEYKSVGGLTGISIDSDSFKSIVGRNSTMPEIPGSFHKVKGKDGAELNVRAFQFDNAKLITTFNKATNKTRCYVADSELANLPQIDYTQGEYSDVDFSAFDSE